MIEPAGTDSVHPRAFLNVGGLTLARQQLALVLAMGCERVACIARQMDPEVLELQHAAEKAGVQFHVITSGRGLLGLVTAGDELIVLAEGLLASPAELRRLVDLGPGVIVQPAEPGLAAGFERIDLDTASAGALRIPGRLAEKLADLPSDFDVVSALQRIALQAGVPQRSLTAASAETGNRWTLVRNEAEAHALESQWIRDHVAQLGPVSPGNWISRKIAQRFGPALLHTGGGGRQLSWGAAACGLIGLGIGWLGQPLVGIAVCGAGWVAQRTAQILRQVERDALFDQRRGATASLFEFALDAAFVVLLGWATSAPEFAYPGERFFAPLMLFAMLRLVPRAAAGAWVRWLDDRAVVSVALLAVFATGFSALAIPLLAVALALAGIALPARQRG